jgi:hypothetical protein
MVSNKFLAGIAALFCAASVQAAPISLSSSLALGTQVTEGHALTLQIDVNNLLAKSGFTSQSIISGMLTVNGYSAPNYVVFDSNQSSQTTENVPYQSCNQNKQCTTKTGKIITHTKYTTTNHFDLDADTMTVATGDSSGTAFATDRASSTSDFSAPTLDRTVDDGKGTVNKYYQRNNDSYFSISGGLQVLLNLDNAALLDLAEDGVLDLSISSFKGKFSVNDVRLDFTAEHADTPAQSDIPLPTSLLLTALGLAALGVARRRQA